MDVILVIAAIVILFLLIGFLLKVVRAALVTAIGIVVIVLVLQFGFGVTPQAIWQSLNSVWESILQFLGR